VISLINYTSQDQCYNVNIVKYYLVNHMFMTVEVLLILFLVCKSIQSMQLHPMRNTRLCKNRRKKMAGCTRYPLKVELLVTLGSIHPWLIKTAETCASVFFSEEELNRL